MKQKKIILIAAGVALLAVLAAGMFLLYRHFSPKAQAGAKHIALTIVDDQASERSFELDTDAQYLLEVLEAVPELEIAGEASAEYGYTLYTINGVTADFNQNSAYWAIYVGEEYGLYNISQQPVEDGGSYTIRYETY